MDRVLRNTSATITVTFYNGASPVEADAVVTVVAKKADDTTLFTTPATNDPAVGVYSVVIPPQANLNILTLTWSGNFSTVPITIESTVEIVGGFYFSIAELRAYDKTLQNETRFSDDDLIRARDEVEAEFEDICGRAFVPRFHRETGVVMEPDSYMLWLEKPEPIRFTSVNVVGTEQVAWADAGYFQVDKYSKEGIHVNGLAVQLFAYQDTFLYPSAVIAEYEYGMTSVPIPIKQKALKRAKINLLGQNSTIDDRALTMTIPDIGTVNLATPGVRGSQTGVPDIDVVLERYTISGSSGGVGAII